MSKAKNIIAMLEQDAAPGQYSFMDKATGVVVLALDAWFKEHAKGTDMQLDSKDDTITFQLPEPNGGKVTLKVSKG